MAGEGEATDMVRLDEHEADGTLRALLDKVETGEEVHIVKDGKVIARIVPAGPPHGARGASWLGMDRGLFEVPEDFDEMSDEELAEFGT
jgi:antitoxin (DNA-binding transcriptional repressor) of toxin-antitoxin stability system